MDVDHENSNILTVKVYTGIHTMEITQMFINSSMDKQILVFHPITCYMVMGMNELHVTVSMNCLNIMLKARSQTYSISVVTNLISNI